MSYNASYFVETLPDEFDNWNISKKLDHYNDFLSGFSYLSNTTQAWVAETFDKEGIKWLWDTVHNPTYVQDMIDMGYNTTQIFYEYLSDPAKLQELFAGITTTMMTTEAPLETICNYVDSIGNEIVNIMVIPAFMVIFLLAFFKRRTSLCKSCCFRRPHLLYPINFVDEHKQRWAYAAVFAIITYKVLALFDNEYFWIPKEFEDPEWTKKYGWCKVFVVIANVAQLCLVYYPFLACLVLRRMLLANIIALLYMCPWIWYFVEVWQVCPFWDKSHTMEEKNTAIMNFVMDIPVVISFLCLIGAYVYNLGVCIYKLCQKKKQNIYQNNEMLVKLMDKDPLSVQYVRDLMKREPKQPPGSVVHKVKEKILYKRAIGFKYSPRVVCTMVVAGLGIYKLAVLLTALTEIIFQSLHELYDSLGDSGTLVKESEDYEFYREFLYIGKWSLIASVWVSFIMHVIFMVHMVIMYRRHLRRYFQGDRTWHFEVTSSPVDVMIASLRYSGYQMAYVVYGFLILFLLLTAVMAAIGGFIALPIKYKFSGPLVNALIGYWPTIVVSIFILLLQKFLAKMFLLQGRGKYMALDNRRFYHIVSFFFFFYNFLVGLFSCLKRIVFSIVFGTLLISRLDHCLLMRGFERFDAGFRAYIGMLTIDVYHNHPVMKSFIYILQQLLEEKNKSAAVNYSEEGDNGQVSLEVMENGKAVDEKPKRSKKYKNKWFKAVTLMRNPTLRLDLMKDEIKQSKSNKQAIRDAVINRTGDVSAGVIGLGIFGGSN